MRGVIAALTAAGLLTASAALAAPTCVDRQGGAVRCGTARAMPVGWSLSPQAQLELQALPPPEPVLEELVGPFWFVAAFVALICLMPKFDGWSAGDWGDETDDDGNRK